MELVWQIAAATHPINTPLTVILFAPTLTCETLHNNIILWETLALKPVII